MKPWSQLANAHLIDWVIESLSTNPKKWSAARDATRDATRTEAWDATQNAVLNATQNAALDATLQTVRDAIENVTRIAIWSDAWSPTLLAARYAARNAILVLIVYDDCQQYLDMTYDQLLAIIVDDQY